MTSRRESAHRRGNQRLFMAALDQASNNKAKILTVGEVSSRYLAFFVVDKIVERVEVVSRTVLGIGMWEVRLR